MHAQREAESVGCLAHVVCPVATLLLAALGEVDDAHHALLLAVWVEVVARDERLAGIFRSAHEVDDVVLLLQDALLSLIRVDDVLVIAEFLPVVAVHLYLDARSGGVLDHVALADTDETVDVVPGIVEDAGIVWYRIVLQSGCRDARYDGKLAVLAHLRSLAPDACVGVRSLAHARHEVAQRVIEVEQRDDFGVDRRHDVAEVAEEDMLYAPLVIWYLQAAIRNVLVADIDYLGVVTAQDDDLYRPEEELHVGGLLHEDLVDGVLQAEVADLCVGGVLLGLPIHEAHTLPVAALDIERHGSLRHHISAQQLLQGVWHVVVIAIVNILVELTALSLQDARGGVAHLSGTQETGIPPILLLDGGGVCNPAHALCHESVATVGTAGSYLLKLIFFLFHVINILVSPGTGECRCPERCEPRHLPD